MDNRLSVSAVCSLPVPQRLHCVILSLCQLLTLNDDDGASSIGPTLIEI